jgi:alcohol/geraniol dehydrogenase (NADP+)
MVNIDYFLSEGNRWRRGEGGAAVNVNGVRNGHGPATVRAYAALGQGQPLQPWCYEAGELGPEEVEVHVTHCGVCHTDLHLIDNDLGLSHFPLVPGHEVVGRVSALGSNARGLEIGQRVGVGWQRGTCLHCEWCRLGMEHLCRSSRPTPLAGFGGFARSLRVDHRFAVPIPNELDSAAAAPLLCGGITVYAPLSRLVRPASRVGVVGIGGLGHLALQFARAMGAEVYAFSTSPEKRAESLEFGAHHFIDSMESGQMKKLAGSLDLLVATPHMNLDWAAWLATLRANGTFLLLGAAPGPVEMPVLPMIFGQFSFTGSVIGPPKTIAEMLRFAALHKIRPAVEVVPMDQVNLALERVRRNQARYRMVLARQEVEL